MTARKLPHLLLAALAATMLTACVHDTASYVVEGDRMHGITLTRAQKWFWADTMDLAVLVRRGDQCQGGMNIPDTRLGDEVALYKAPDEYAEPLYLLKIDDRVFAASTESCQAQAFDPPPKETGTLLGTFKADATGQFGFIAAPGK